MRAYRRFLPAAVAILATALAPAGASAYAPSPPTKGVLYSDGQTGRYLLGGQWLYRADPTDAGTTQGWWSDTASSAGWAPVSVPNSDNAGNVSPGSMGGTVGWYRRDFTLPARAFAAYLPASARRWIVRFESANYTATVWLNGRRLGGHTGANLPFEFDLSGLRRGGVNRLVVRVDNRIFPDQLPPGPGGGWWNYGGLLREVYLRRVQAVDVASAQIRPLLRCPPPAPGRCAAVIKEQVVLRNLTGAPRTVQLSGRYGTVAVKFGPVRLFPHGTRVVRASVAVPRPKLWAPGHPALYRATLRLSDGQGRPLGGYVSYSGIRSIKVTPAGRLTLNGRPVHLRGVELREQDLRTGGALTPARIRQLVGWVRSLGATVIRADAPNPELAELADREGLLLWLDIPENNTVTDQYLQLPAWLAKAHGELAGNIEANQNHPSVMVWSIGNELPTPVPDSEAAYIAGATALAHRLDPTRPVAMSLAYWPDLPCQPAYAPLDVLAVNEYFGWYSTAAGSTDDRDALGPFLDEMRACYPTQALFVSEFGFEANRNGPTDERGTYQFQANSVAYHLGVFASKPWLSGAIYFLLQDAFAWPGFGGGNPWPFSPFLQKGLRDVFGQAKPAWGVVSSIYHGTVQIGR